MIFRQILNDDLGCASYLVGDDRAGVAAVVDPRLEIDVYLELAATAGVRITDIFETHNHADHVSGHGRLAAATGARIHVHRLTGAKFAHEPFDDGDRWLLGEVRIEALHTPGHRPEHTAFVIADTRRGERPAAVLTGDSLLVGDVARPDLAIERHAGARDIHASLQRLLALGDDVEVWPGHVGGSMCGGPGLDRRASSTIGYERACNPMLGCEGREAFVDAALSSLGPQPPNLRAIVALNHGPFAAEPATLRAWSVDQVAAVDGPATVLVDLRPGAEFAAGHVPGSVSLPVGVAGFGTKLAWVAAEAAAIVFVGDPERVAEATALAGAVGLQGAVAAGGSLAGGFAAWAASGRAVATLRQVDVAAFAALVESTPELGVLDVRPRADWLARCVPGSVCVPWHDITGIPVGLRADRPIAVICASGQRAGIAASLLMRHGASHVLHVTGGGVADVPSAAPGSAERRRSVPVVG